MKRMRPSHWFAIAIGIAAAIASAKAARPAELAAANDYENSVLHVRVTGHGRPMVFIPGLASSGDVWNDAVARYADRHECHAVTLGGFAGRPRFEGPFLETARASLLAYLRERKIENPIVVGHSLGGVLAMELALAAPGRIGPVVVLDALPFLGGAGDPDATPETVRARFEPMHRMIASQTQEQYAAFQRNAPHLRAMVTAGNDLAKVVEWAAGSDRRAVADGMMDVATTDLRGRLAGMKSPLLVLGTWYGFRDVSTREAVEKNFRDQYAAVPGWTFATADSARHFVMLDAPEWTWSAVDAFLAAKDARTAAKGGAR